MPSLRHLQTAERNVAIQEHEALKEHGIASVTCLLAGFNVLTPTYAEHARYLRLIRGLHSLHVYANEYWVEYILENAALAAGLKAESTAESTLHSVACELAKRLNASPTFAGDPSAVDSTSLDSRLEFLRNQSTVYELVRAVLKSRSARSREIQVDQQGMW